MSMKLGAPPASVGAPLALGGRAGLLSSIQTGTSLRKTQTVDKSAPCGVVEQVRVDDLRPNRPPGPPPGWGKQKPIKLGGGAVEAEKTGLTEERRPEKIKKVTKSNEETSSVASKPSKTKPIKLKDTPKSRPVSAAVTAIDFLTAGDPQKSSIVAAAAHHDAEARATPKMADLSKSQIFYLTLPALCKNDAKWVDDKDCTNCELCFQSFGFTTRRHHCRRCGRCVCGKCSSNNARPCVNDPLFRDQNEKLRVCDTCFGALGGSSTAKATEFDFD